MPLTLVAIPIGNVADIGARALGILNSAEVVILEEFKESSQFLRSQGISGKTLLQLNEHTTQDELKELTEICKSKQVALITDCGTPGFCDPGASLVSECRKNGLLVDSIPGPSSLMMILSLSSQRLDRFEFRGFLPAENEARSAAWMAVAKEKFPFVVMDTPYRFQKMLSELQKYIPQRRVLIGANLTQPDQLIWEGVPEGLKLSDFPKKAEFIILVYALGKLK